MKKLLQALESKTVVISSVMQEYFDEELTNIHKSLVL